MVDFSSTLAKLKTRFTGLKNRFSSTDKSNKTLEDLHELAKSRPGDMRIQIKIADVHYKAREIDKALESMDLVAKTYLEQGFPQKALAAYRKMLMMNPNEPAINESMAEIHEQSGQSADAVIQYRIALQHHFNSGDKDRIIATTKKIASLDGSLLNKRRLAEIYQSFGMMNEALAEFENVAQLYRQNKQFDDLLKLYEIILPHKPTNHNLIRDICILYLRKQQPDQAIKAMERYKVDADPAFNDLYEKAKLMKKALRTAAKAS